MLSDNAATLFVTNYTQYMYLYETNVYIVSFSAKFAMCINWSTITMHL